MYSQSIMGFIHMWNKTPAAYTVYVKSHNRYMHGKTDYGRYSQLGPSRSTFWQSFAPTLIKLSRPGLACSGVELNSAEKKDLRDQSCDPWDYSIHTFSTLCNFASHSQKWKRFDHGCVNLIPLSLPKNETYLSTFSPFFEETTAFENYLVH